MSTVNNLLAGSNPYQVLQEQCGKLAGKWSRSGLLEGIESSTDRNNMSMLLENQAKQLVNESNSTAGSATNITTGNGEAWAGVALPLVRRVFGEIVAKDLISVQPMNLPAGLIFYLDFQYGTDVGSKAVGESLYGATDDLKRTEGGFDQGLYGAGEFAYSIAQLAASGAQVDMSVALTSGKWSTSSADFGGILNMDTEFSASHAGEFGGSVGATSVVKTLAFHTGILTDYDPSGVRAFHLVSSSGEKLDIFPQFTRLNTSTSAIEFVVSTSADYAIGGDTGIGVTVKYQAGPDNLDNTGDFEDTFPTAGSGAVSTQSIPEINVQLRSDTVAAKTRKLKAQWTPEFAQDLNAYHSIDAEAELTSILSEYISMEIDLEILDMLIRNADTVEGWSATVAKDVTVSSNNTAGGGTNPTFTSTIFIRCILH